MNLPDPQVECWDYTFAQNSNALIYVAVVEGDRNSVVTFAVGHMWKYLVAADTKEELMADIASFSAPEDTRRISAELYALGEVIQNWRLVRYNGRKVCVYGCHDYTPDSCAAYPAGPIAPVTNGWLYYMVDQNQNPMTESVGGFDLPIISEHPNNLVEYISKGLDSDVDLIADVGNDVADVVCRVSIESRPIDVVRENTLEPRTGVCAVIGVSVDDSLMGCRNHNFLLSNDGRG